MSHNVTAARYGTGQPAAACQTPELGSGYCWWWRSIKTLYLAAGRILCRLMKLNQFTWH
ncbi:hypothetical protein [Bythopirellula polymerisocia]|uniref:hypothetical protein n=1 Tax=Bythopirellula polymerisocia TaxID=2528003 RepID=UPI0018D3CBB5|nr:hypothetical protein [Bythopirellula polymerisocia]